MMVGLPPPSAGANRGAGPPSGPRKGAIKPAANPSKKGGIKRIQPLTPLKGTGNLPSGKSPGRPIKPSTTKPVPAMKPNKPSKPGLRT